MASWKKIIISGSNAELNSLSLSSALTPANGGLGLTAASVSGVPVGSGTNSYSIVGSNGSGQILRNYAIGVVVSGSFSGSFYGDGSNLTGVSSAPTFKLSGSTAGTDFNAATDTLYFTTASSHGFDMSMSFSGTRKTMSLVTPQPLRTTDIVTFAGVNGGSISGSRLNLSAMGGGTGNKVVVVDANNFLVSQSIDSRVWGTSLIDGSGASTRLAIFSDADTVSSDSNLTYTANVLTVNGSTFGQNVTIAGDLTVLGNVVQLQITNLNIEDRFVYINSGSSTGDGGFIVSTGSAGNGVAFGFDDSQARWGIQQATLLTVSSSALSPEAWMASVIDVDGGQSILNYHTRNGNIRIESGEIYIYA